MLNYRLNRKLIFSITKTKQPLRLKPALKSEEGREKWKEGHRVLPINTNTTFDSPPLNMILYSYTHAQYAAHSRTPTSRWQSEQTLSPYKIFQRSHCEHHQKEKKNLDILYIYIYIFIHLFIHILIYKNKTIIKSIESQMFREHRSSLVVQQVSPSVQCWSRAGLNNGN